MIMASRFWTLFLLVLVAHLQVAAGAGSSIGQDGRHASWDAPVLSSSLPCFVKQRLGPARRSLHSKLMEPPDPQILDCLATEDSDETSSSGGRGGEAQIPGDRSEDAVDHASASGRIPRHVTSPDHPLIYHLCKLVI
jgi:hypothetical protein